LLYALLLEGCLWGYHPKDGTGLIGKEILGVNGDKLMYIGEVFICENVADTDTRCGERYQMG
jgi:hypothetical protein